MYTIPENKYLNLHDWNWTFHDISKDQDGVIFRTGCYEYQESVF